MIPVNKVYRLPDYYDKSQDSNNHHILEIQYQGAAVLNDEVELVRLSSSLDDATGHGLDVWGAIYDIARNGMGDEAYRMRIKAYIAARGAGADYGSWFQALLNIFGADPADIECRETGDPYEIEITRFPLDIIVSAGFGMNEATELIESISPVVCKIDARYSVEPIRETIGLGILLANYSKPPAIRELSYWEREAVAEAGAAILAHGYAKPPAIRDTGKAAAEVDIAPTRIEWHQAVNRPPAVDMTNI